MSLIEGLALYLEHEGLGTWLPGPSSVFDGDGWVIAAEVQPPAPLKAITLYTTPGGESPGNLPYDSVGLTVQVVGDESPATSRNQAMRVFSHLHGLKYRTLSDTDATYVGDCIASRGWPSHEGPDAQGRHIHQLEFRLDVDLPTVHRPSY